MRTIGRLLLLAIFLVLTVLLVLAAKYAPALVFSFYPELSRKLLSGISSVTSAIPLAVWELLAGLAVLWLLYTFVRIFTQRRSFLCWLAGIVLSVCVGLFLFVALWGLNHFGPTVGEQLGLSVREYTKQELTDATRYYAAQVNALADDVSRDDQGLAQLSSFEELSKQAGAGYDKLAARYELFTGSHDPVKKLATWRMFSQFGITGIFVCFTGEACVNPDTYEVWLPFTMCHELAHRQTVAAEDGANFCAYLACMENESPEFQYSGAIAAYVYCHNALYKADRTAASEIWQSLKGACAQTFRRPIPITRSTRGRSRTRLRRSTIRISRLSPRKPACRATARLRIFSLRGTWRKSRAKRKNVLDKCRELLYNNSRDGQLAQLV